MLGFHAAIVMRCFLGGHRENNYDKILFLGRCQKHAVRMIMACDDSDEQKKHLCLNVWGPIQKLIMRISGHVW